MAAALSHPAGDGEEGDDTGVEAGEEEDEIAVEVGEGCGIEDGVLVAWRSPLPAVGSEDACPRPLEVALQPPMIASPRTVRRTAIFIGMKIPRLAGPA
jgi:hypothetical protein